MQKIDLEPHQATEKVVAEKTQVAPEKLTSVL